MKEHSRIGSKRSGRLAWIDDVTDDDLRDLSPADARKMRLLRLARALERGVLPAPAKRMGRVPARRPGAGGRGQRRGHAKLDRQGAEWIKAWAAAGYAQRAIATAFNVSQPVVSGIVSGRRWRTA